MFKISKEVAATSLAIYKARVSPVSILNRNWNVLLMKVSVLLLKFDTMVVTELGTAPAGSVIPRYVGTIAGYLVDESTLISLGRVPVYVIKPPVLIVKSVESVVTF
jgi:hypothetical protein